MSRPGGRPGVVEMLSGYHDAVMDHDDQLHIWLDDEWVQLDEHWHDAFTPDDVPEWVTQCCHDPLCDTETECDRQWIADDRQSRAEADR